jgi:hypothetical protein
MLLSVVPASWWLLSYLIFIVLFVGVMVISFFQLVRFLIIEVPAVFRVVHLALLIAMGVRMLDILLRIFALPSVHPSYAWTSLILGGLPGYFFSLIYLFIVLLFARFSTGSSQRMQWILYIILSGVIIIVAFTLYSLAILWPSETRALWHPLEVIFALLVCVSLGIVVTPLGFHLLVLLHESSHISHLKIKTIRLAAATLVCAFFFTFRALQIFIAVVVLPYFFGENLAASSYLGFLLLWTLLFCLEFIPALLLLAIFASHPKDLPRLVSESETTRTSSVDSQYLENTSLLSSELP